MQCCPACGVPTVRSEGCNAITCVCGAAWEWRDSPTLATAGTGVAELREMLDGGLDPDFADEDGLTLLMAAAQQSRAEERGDT